MILPDLLSEAARRFPNKPAALFLQEHLSLARLDRESSQLAGRLLRSGVGPGSRVAFLWENSLAGVIAYWGVMKSGAVSVDISTLATESTVIDVLLECAPIAIAISAQQLHRMTKRGVPAGFPRTIISTGAAVAIARDTDLDVHSLDEIREIEEPEASLPRVDECDAAMIICTSGTTGRSKGVMLSHRNLISNLLSVNSLMGLTHDDSMLLAVPLHYIHGRMQLLTHTLIGGTVAFSSGFHMPQSVLGELVKYKVSGFSGVPFHFKRLLERSALKTTPLPDLKYVVITGGAMPPAELQALAEAMPGVAIHVAYGLTEASPRIANLPPSDVTTRPTSCGRPIPGVSVEIVDDEGVRVTPGEVGEVVVSGPNVMLGYVSGDERELGTIDADGRLHTGDLGRMDADGYLYLVGRKSEMIKVAGERIFPAEIEDVVKTHPAVQDSVVVGAADEILGEKIVAFVVPIRGAQVSEHEIRSHCLQSLPFVRTPRTVLIMDQLPQTGSGKLDRGALKSVLRLRCQEEERQKVQRV